MPKPSSPSPGRGVHLEPLTAAVGSLFDFIEDLQFWIKDRQGRYGWVNRGFLLNYSLERREEVIGKTDYDLSPEHLADQYVLDDERVLAGHRIVSRVELVGRFDHTAVWSVTDKVPLADARGRIIGTTGITRPLRGRPGDAAWPREEMSEVVAFIRGHHAEAIGNETLARLAGLSLRAFERKFLKLFHVSPQQYLRRMRVRLACHALVYSHQALAQIAGACGFCDQSHFTREFRRETGLTPGQYRQRYSGRAAESPGQCA